MPVAMYVIFVAVGVLIASELGCLLSASEKKERPISRRCRKPREVHRRRVVRGQRERCRFGG